MGTIGGIVPTEQDIREQKLKDQVMAYAGNAKTQFLENDAVSYGDIATYASGLIAERKAALLKNMFGHLSPEDLRIVARIAREHERASVAPVLTEFVEEPKSGRGRPRKS